MAPRHLLVGGFTRPARHGKALGLGLLRLPAYGQPETLTTLAMDDPSWIARHPRLPDLFYVAHSDAGHVSHVAVDATHTTLHLAGSQPTGGHNTAHVACSPEGRWVLAASFASGHVTAFPLDADGDLQPASCTLALVAPHGPLRTQLGCQPHQVVFSPDGRFALVPDRGSDGVWVLALDAATGRLEVASRTTAPPGAGPRHLAWHPRLPVAYLVNELDSSIAVHAWDATRAVLAPVAVWSLLPAGFVGTNISAGVAVSPDGRFIYASNRGQDGIAILAVTDNGLALRPVGWQTGTGALPRFLALNGPRGETLWLASHGDDALRAYARDAATGGLHLQTHIASPSPACVLALEGACATDITYPQETAP